MLEFYSYSTPVARKEHTCELCGSVIHPKQKYYRCSGKYDGMFFDSCYCLNCNNIITEFCCEVDNEWDEDSIREYLSDKYCSRCDWFNPDFEECDKDVLTCSHIIERIGE